jgi:hypothetical protein
MSAELNTKRFKRSMREAFPFDEPFWAEGPYTRGATEGWLKDVLGVLVVVALVALTVHTLVDWAALP